MVVIKKGTVHTWKENNSADSSKSQLEECQRFFNIEQFSLFSCRPPLARCDQHIFSSSIHTYSCTMWVSGAGMMGNGKRAHKRAFLSPQKFSTHHTNKWLPSASVKWVTDFTPSRSPHPSPPHILASPNTFRTCAQIVEREKWNHHIIFILLPWN